MNNETRIGRRKAIIEGHMVKFKNKYVPLQKWIEWHPGRISTFSGTSQSGWLFQKLLAQTSLYLPNVKFNNGLFDFG